MLNCRNLSKKFERTLFNKLNINLEKGEILAITGPSGCGKTTLLRCICGLEKLDSGSIFLNGKEITDSPAEVRNIGLLFQKPVLYPHLSVSGNLSLASRDNHDKALIEVGLSGFGNRDVYTLSGGEGQRVALARALLANPRVLLLDEPFSALDSDLSLKLINDVRALLKSRECPAILVTHNIEEAELFSDRILNLLDSIN
tara:strand:- start:550 stop:1149 length:600 start_codon:yes stop_codon:yes gene_type:complete